MPNAWVEILSLAFVWIVKEPALRLPLPGGRPWVDENCGLMWVGNAGWNSSESEMPLVDVVISVSRF